MLLAACFEGRISVQSKASVVPVWWVMRPMAAPVRWNVSAGPADCRELAPDPTTPYRLKEGGEQ